MSCRKKKQKMPTETESNKDEWTRVHQPFELDWHSNDNYRWHDDQFLPAWKHNFADFMELEPDEFGVTDIILDLGCGSRSAFSYFTQGEKFYIDPLRNEYLKIPEVAKYWSDKEQSRFFRAPAEEKIVSLIDGCAFVNCWNVLDHCYDWRQVIDNVIAYAETGGIIALCTDLKSHGDGHPGIDNPAELFNLIMEQCCIEKLEVNYSEPVRDVAMKLIKQKEQL